MAHQTHDLDTRTILAIAAESDTDPRSVRAELAAQRGQRAPVRGRAGERVRRALMARGLLSQLDRMEWENDGAPVATSFKVFRKKTI